MKSGDTVKYIGNGHNVLINGNEYKIDKVFENDVIIIKSCLNLSERFVLRILVSSEKYPNNPLTDALCLFFL